jgi:hypothetical protein
MGHRQSHPIHIGFPKLNVLPVGAGLFDLLENICIVTLLMDDTTGGVICLLPQP